MKRPPAWNHAPLDAVIVRTPLLSFDVLARWGAAGPDDAALRRELRRLLDDPMIREAIFVSSPELEANLERWLANPDDPEARDLEQAVVRYVCRMAGRATPFGLMSAIGVGRVGPASHLVTGPRDAARRQLRLDNDFLVATCVALARDPAIRAGLRYLPNSSLYTAGGKLRYAEARLAGDMRSYHLVVVEPSDYLLALLERARGGATIAELVAVLLEDPDVGTEDAEAFVGELIDTQLLVPDLEPVVTGPEPLGPIIEQLRPLAPVVAETLATLDARLAAIEAAPLGLPSARYRALVEGVGALPIAPQIRRLVQVDLFKPSPELVLGQAVVDEVTRALPILHRIGGMPEDEGWPRFRSKFVERYQTREVPLVEVLDEELGIGFLQANPPVAPLLDVAFPARSGHDERRVPWGRREARLLHLLQRVAQTGAQEVELTTADEANLAVPSPPPIFDVLAVPISLAARSPEALEAGDFRVRVLGTDAPGVRMLGRFCHGSPEIDALARDVIAREEARRPDAIFAEVVHLPEGRIGNVLLRPVLRGHEIPFLGKSSAEHQIPVTDLMVSVVGDRVVLRSRRLGKQILPRLTSAHNFTRFSLGIYRFLSALAIQDGSLFGWSWGPFADAQFLPRIRTGRTILARARWLLTSAELSPIKAATKAGAKTTPFAAVTALRERLRLPRWIVVAEFDNELPVDLENRLAVDSFANMVKNKRSVELYELFPAPDELGVRGADGAYVHELQLLYARPAEPAVTKELAPPPSAARREGRLYGPGSSWLYLKYYTGTAMADEVLRAIAPVVRELQTAGTFDRWFFLRYGDPDWHLRIRFGGRSPEALLPIAARLEAALREHAANGLVWKTQVDTYDREVERYGGPAAVDVAERLFAADSDAVLAILAAYEADAGAQVMWQLALLGIDRMLDDLGLALADKRALYTRMRDSFGAEVGMDTAFQKRLGDKFRRHRPEIEAVLGATDEDGPYGPGLAAFARRSEVIRPLAAELVALRARGELTTSIPELAQSYIHMHANRMLAAAPRQQELVIYDLLRRHHDGVAGRAKQAAKKGES